ncbi:MAG: hypothetical protein RRC34_01255 [Lentisphaeria bacterium]|nr:hypothetical protein [Lentisphaeria bacterium]
MDEHAEFHVIEVAQDVAVMLGAVHLLPALLFVVGQIWTGESVDHDRLLRSQ